MDPITLAFATAVISLVTKYGIPMAIDLLALWKDKNQGDLTEAKVLSLLEDLKRPESYFW